MYIINKCIEEATVSVDSSPVEWILMVGSHIFLNELFKKLNFENKIDLGSFPEFQVLKAGAGGNATTGWHFEETPGRNLTRNLLLGKLPIVS